MDEVYTCICGGQAFSIHENGRIRCSKCQKEYLLDIGDEMESPTDFNERIRTEEHGGLIMKQTPFRIKLIEDKG